MTVQTLAAPLSTLADRRLLGWAAAGTLLSLLVYGLITAIIPNPVFGRGIAPEPFAIVTWLASAPLMGLVLATYLAPPPASAVVPLGTSGSRDGSTLGAIGGMAAFLAIGCPTCNKIALLLLGASGAVTVFGPIQPFIGAASLVLLAVTLAWRLRIRSRGGSCGVVS